MNLNYDKIKSKIESSGNHWTSYSDLFLVLSVTFLLLFVVLNIRSGAMTLATQRQVKLTLSEVENLRKQIKAYENLRDDYLGQEASQDEVKLYQELMSKLSLLEEEASQERSSLQSKAREAQEKEKELNRYQQLVKNIISSNLVSNARVKKRDEVIEESRHKLSKQEKELGELSYLLSQREAQIAKNNDQIQEIEDELQKKINQVKEVYHHKNKSERMMQREIAQLKKERNQQLDHLKSQNSNYLIELKLAQEKLEYKNRESEKLLTELQQIEQKHEKSIEELQKTHHEALVRETEAHQKSMEQYKNAESRLKEEQEYRVSVELQKEDYQKKLGAVTSELDATRKNIQDIQNQYHSSIEGLKKSNLTLQKNLFASNAKLSEQRTLAERIKKNIQSSGVSAAIDPKTGDMTIQFPEEYFDKNRSDLKPGMRKILDKLIPIYAKSLFHDAKVSKKISAVEIVGFSSPTYMGKYVDPDSLSILDRPAVNYNMDLSYRRAKSIFEYIFDTERMSFSHQKDLLPLVKVSGRSYLATDRLSSVGRSPAGEKNYCDLFDCRKSQKVIIKFNLKDE